MPKVEFGLSKIRLTAAKADGTFPNFETATEFKDIQFIVMDSFSEDKADDQTTDISVEDFDSPILQLTGQKGLRSMSFQSNDLSTEQYQYLFGYTVSTEGWTVETPGFVLPVQALQYTTKAIDQYPATVHEYAKANVKVKKTGTTGKNGLPNLQFNITFPANIDPTGVELQNHRLKSL